MGGGTGSGQGRLEVPDRDLRSSQSLGERLQRRAWISSIPIADPSPQHDVANRCKRGDLGHWSYSLRTKRIALRVSKRMATADGEYPDPRINSIGRNDAEHIRARPDRTQYVVGLMILRGEHPHLTACLPDGGPPGRS